MYTLKPVIDLSTITIIPSYKCHSANCVDCYQKQTNDHIDYKEMCHESIDIENLITFLKKYLTTIKIDWLGIIGGEIFDYQKIDELLYRLSKEFPNMKLILISNGQNHKKINSILKNIDKEYPLFFEFSIDGYGDVCDHLRGRKGYFDNVLQSIEKIVSWNNKADIHVNTRYYPEYEDSIIQLADTLDQYGIKRTDFSILETAFSQTNNYAIDDYVKKHKDFVGTFWGDDVPSSIPRAHKKYKKYLPHTLCSFSYPGIRPNGDIYSCFEYQDSSVKVGHINDDDIPEIISKLLNLSKINPSQCDNCPLGQYVIKHHELSNECQ